MNFLMTPSHRNLIHNATVLPTPSLQIKQKGKDSHSQVDGSNNQGTVEGNPMDNFRTSYFILKNKSSSWQLKKSYLLNKTAHTFKVVGLFLHMKTKVIGYRDHTLFGSNFTGTGNTPKCWSLCWYKICDECDTQDHQLNSCFWKQILKHHFQKHFCP